MIEAILKGGRREKQEAIGLLYDQCFPVILKLVATTEDKTLAEDIFQEGMAHLYNNLISGKFEGRSKLSTYLIGICKNIWLMRLRQKTVHFTADQQPEIVASDSEEMVNEEMVHLLLSKMDSGCADLLIAIYYEHKPVEEIEQQFKLGSNQALRNKKSKCLKKLMQFIKDSGLTYESFLK